MRSEIRHSRVLRTGGAVALLVCVALGGPAALAGCGGAMSVEEYSDAVYSINLDIETEMNGLFSRMQEQLQGGVKEISLEGLRASERMTEVFRVSLEKARKMKPPAEARELHSEVLDLYTQGMELGRDLTEAYDYLYAISGVLDEFSSRGLEAFQVGVMDGDQALLVAALEIDIRSMERCLEDIDLEVGGAALPIKDFFRGFFAGLKSILERARSGLVSGDQESRPRLNRELTEYLSGLLQAESEGLPGFAALAERLIGLRDLYQDIAGRVNDL
jgi:hypothetical protein